jgi:CBS domain-containing protein
MTILTQQTLVTVAVKRMIERHVSAVMISEDGTPNSRLLGIFTERDLTVRIVGAGRDPHRTRLGEVMTRNPDTLPPEATAWDALVFMQNRNYRHLPVVQDDRIVGVVSIRDLFAVVTEQLEDDVHACEAFVFGSAYSLDTVVDRQAH